MTESDDRRREQQALRARVQDLLQRAADTEQSMLALARGEVDAVSLAASATPVLLQAAQESLRRSELLLRRIFDGALDGMLLADDSGSYVDVNHAACELFGLPRERLLGRNIAEFAAPGYDGQSSFRAFQAQGAMRGRFPLQRPDGGQRILEFSAVASVVPGLHLSVLRDITERVAAEEALRRSEARFRMMIEKSADGISLTAADGSTLFRSASLARMIGGSIDDPNPEAPIDAAHLEDRPRVLDATARLLGGERENVVEYRARHRDGSLRWIEAHNTNLLDDPDVRAIVGNSRDITARKQLDEALRESERRYRRLIEDLPEPILVHVDGRIAFANAASVEMVGAASREELVGHEIAEFATEATRAELTAWPGATASAEHVQRVELRFIRQSDGRELHVEVDSIEITFDGEPATLGIGRDVTERVEAVRAAAAALRAEQRSQRLQRIAGKAAMLGGWILDLSDGNVAWSDEVCAIHEVPAGYCPDVVAAIQFYAPEHRAQVGRAVEQCATEGAAFDAELEVITATGRRRWVRAIGEAVRAPGGQIVQVQGAFQDITERRNVEASLRASEQRFRVMANSISQLAWIASGDGAVSWFNQRWYEYTGTTPEQVTGWCWSSVHDPARLPGVLAQWRQSIASGEALELEFPLRGADGQFRDFLTRAVPIEDADGKVVQWFGTSTDVHALKRVESSLRHSQEKLKDAQRIANVGSWEWNIVAGTFEWSEQTFALLGIPPDECAGYEAFSRAVHHEDRQRTHQAIEDALRGRAAYDVEHRVLLRDGSVRVLHARGEVMRDAAGRPVHMAGTVLDITERKRAETHLAETNRALQLLSHSNEALVRSENEEALLATVCRIAVAEGGFRSAWVGYAQDDEGQTIAPQAYAGVELSVELSGAWSSWSVDTASGQGPAGQVIRSGEPMVIADLASEASFAPWREAATRNGFRGLVCLPLKQGASTFGLVALYMPEVRVPLDYERRVLRELADDLAFGIVTLRAQADRHRLQMALQKVAASSSASTGAQFFEQLASNAAAALGAQVGYVARLLPGLPPSARTIAATVRGQSIAGFDYVLQGTPCEGLVDRQELIVQARVSELYQLAPAFAESGVQSYVGRRLDDSSGQPMGMLCVLFREPLKSTAFVRSTLQIFSTRAAAELERQRTDARLREQASLLDKAQDAIFVHDLDDRILYWNKSAERRYGWAAAEALGRSAKLLLNDDTAAADAAIAATIQRGEWVGELRQRHRDGTPIMVEGRWSLVRDDDGTPRSILAVNTDLTERKQLENAEEQLRQAQKMEAIGSLAGGVAHDFNNILSVVLSYADLLITDLRASDPLRDDLEEVRKAGLRAMALTRQLLAFSRKQILQPIVLDVNQVVSSVEKMLGRLLGEDIELSFLTPPDVGRIYADAGQVEQVIMNLVVNARDAMPQGGSVTIETANVALDDGYAADQPGVTPGAYVMLAVTDTGVGMDPATQARIFEPFFTTKDRSKGTGLGLSTVYGIVQQSRGHIRVFSELGRGTTFKVYLPLSDRALTGAAAAEGKASTTLRGTETILLVEDEDQVRTVMCTILRKNGYHVLEAQNGGEAFLICEQVTATIHLLLTDLVMPRMSGRQLAERLSPSRPEMKVLFVSGYTENTIAQHGVLDAGVDFLAKPIMPEPLLSKVRMVLDQGDSLSLPAG